MSPATRLKQRDYSTLGFYFVTVCANYKRCIFGRVIQTGVELSTCGRIAQECWTTIASHFERVRLHGFIVMPNHVHGIIEIMARSQHRNAGPEGQGVAQHAAPLQKAQSSAPRNLLFGSLSLIERSFKAEVTRRARLELNWKEDIWQRNYFDRVIRDGQEFSDASRYIAENPQRWIAKKQTLQRTNDVQAKRAQPVAPLQRDRA